MVRGPGTFPYPTPDPVHHDRLSYVLVQTGRDSWVVAEWDGKHQALTGPLPAFAVVSEPMALEQAKLRAENLYFARDHDLQPKKE